MHFLVTALSFGGRYSNTCASVAILHKGTEQHPLQRKLPFCSSTKYHYIYQLYSAAGPGNSSTKQNK